MNIVRLAEKKPSFFKKNITLLSLSLFLSACGGEQVTSPQQITEPETTSPSPALDPDEKENSNLPERHEIRIGVMLPLSGDSREIGQSLFNAATLALFDSNDQRLKIIAGDTKGTAEGAIAAMKTMINNQVDVIIGPLFSGNIRAIKPLIKESGINVIGFSTDKTVAGDGVYLLSFRPEDQVKRILHYTMNIEEARNVKKARTYENSESLNNTGTLEEAGGILEEAGGTLEKTRLLNEAVIPKKYKKIAALIPDTAYGKLALSAFNEATLSLETKVTNIEFYPDTDNINSLMPPIKRLAKYAERKIDLRDERRALEYFKEDDIALSWLKKIEKFDTIGEVDFDVLIVPEGGNILKIIAPLLSFFDINTKKVKIIGTGLWDDQSLFNEPQMRGSWFATSNRNQAQRFLSRYKNHYGIEAPRLATLGYDAFALVATMTRSSREPDYSTEALTDEEGFMGIDGIFRFKKNGLLERGLAIYEITRSGFRLIDAAPTDFTDPIFEQKTDPLSPTPEFYQEYDSEEEVPDLSISDDLLPQ